MKKLMLTVAVLFAASTIANAQLFIGGSIGFGTNSDKEKVTTTTTTSAKTETTTLEADPITTTNFHFTPRIGYMLNDKMAVGLDLQYGLSSTKYPVYNGIHNFTDYTKSNTSIAAGIFFRYYLIQKGDFSLYAEAEPYFGSTSCKIEGTYKNLKGESVTYTNDGDQINTLGIAVTPGIAYKLNDHFELDAFVGLFDLSFKQNSTKTNSESEIAGIKTTTETQLTNNQFNIGLNKEVSVNFGIVYTF